MTAIESAALANVLEQVGPWPAAMKVELAQRLLGGIESPAISEPPRTLPLDQVIGILKTDSPPPDDRECQQIIDEERARKYG